MTMARVSDQQVNFRSWLAELDDDSRARFQQFLDLAADAVSGRTAADPRALGPIGH